MSIAPFETDPKQFNGNFQTDFLSVDQLSVADIHELHEEAEAMKWLAQHRGVGDVLDGHVYTLLFWDSDSTRTKYSFNFAIQRLGAKAVMFDQASSSSGKGETFEDTVEMIDAYSLPERDGIIIRHNEEGAIERAAALADAPVTNAGDGKKHPTQAVLDTKTLASKFNLEKLRIAFFGDLAYARTINSTAPLLAKLGVRHMVFVANEPMFRMSPEIIANLRAQGVTVQEHDQLAEVAPEVDAIYATRMQGNLRFPGDKTAQEEFRIEHAGKCYVAASDVEGCDVKILHALPEDQKDLNIDPVLRQDPRCIVKEQAAWGQWTRMAGLVRQAGESRIYEHQALQPDPPVWSHLTVVQ